MVFMSHGLSVARFFRGRPRSAALLVAKSAQRSLASPVESWCAIRSSRSSVKSTGGESPWARSVFSRRLGEWRLRQTVAVVLAASVLLYPALRAATPCPWPRSSRPRLGHRTRAIALLSFRKRGRAPNKARERIMFGWGEYNAARSSTRCRAELVTTGMSLERHGRRRVRPGFGILLVPIFLPAAGSGWVLDKERPFSYRGVGLLNRLIRSPISFRRACSRTYPY